MNTAIATRYAGARTWVRHAHYVLAHNSLAAVGAVALGCLLLLALAGPSLVPYDPIATGVGPNLDPPSRQFWFGTDQVGRDIFSRVIVAARLDLAIAVFAVGLSFVVGTTIGCMAGYFGGWFDRISGRVVDSMMAFPLFVLAMGVVAAMGNSVTSVVCATALVNAPFYVRLARAEVAQRRTAEYVDAAVLAGNRSARVIGRHLLPNVLPTLSVQMSLNLGWAVLNAAGLSFIGLGVRPPAAEWGIMVAEGAQYVVSGQWWACFFPGVALMLCVLCFNFMGDGVRDLLDPRQRS
jgi:peptide/nickel transport system permease protein